MNCAHCGHHANRVTDTKDFGHSITRYRLCRKCGQTFSTRETCKPVEAVRLEPADELDGIMPPSAPSAPSAPKEPKTTGTRLMRYRPADPADVPPGVDAEVVPSLLEWWNEARWSRHQGRATWTKAAFLASAERLATMSADAQLALVREGVERGWQALKRQYRETSTTGMTGWDEFTPTDPRMVEALHG